MHKLAEICLTLRFEHRSISTATKHLHHNRIQSCVVVVVIRRSKLVTKKLMEPAELKCVLTPEFVRARGGVH